MYNYDWSVIPNNMDVFIDGALKTLEISAIAILFAIPIGIIFGLGRISKNKFIYLISSAYVEIIRGVPLLVLLMWIFYVLGQLFRLGSYWGSIVGLAIICWCIYRRNRSIWYSSCTKRADGSSTFTWNDAYKSNDTYYFAASI